MLKHLKKKSNSKSWVGRLRDFGENCANFSFDPEKNTLFYAPIALHHNKMFQKILTTNREIKICIFLDQILLKLLVFQRNNWTCFCILNELLHAKTSQNWPFSGSRDIRLHSFWPNQTQLPIWPKNLYLTQNWLTLLFYTYCAPSC